MMLHSRNGNKVIIVIIAISQNHHSTKNHSTLSTYQNRNVFQQHFIQDERKKIKYEKNHKSIVRKLWQFLSRAQSVSYSH